MEGKAQGQEDWKGSWKAGAKGKGIDGYTGSRKGLRGIDREGRHRI